MFVTQKVPTALVVLKYSEIVYDSSQSSETERTQTDHGSIGLELYRSRNIGTSHHLHCLFACCCDNSRLCYVFLRFFELCAQFLLFRPGFLRMLLMSMPTPISRQQVSHSLTLIYIYIYIYIRGGRIIRADFFFLYFCCFFWGGHITAYLCSHYK